MTGAPAGAGPGELRISGGAGGVAARVDDLDHAATALQRAAGGLAAAAAHTAVLAAGPGLLATGLLAPGTLVRAEEAMVGVLAGPQGLVVSGVRLEALALRLRAAALGYGNAERAAREAVGQLELAAGRLAAGVAAPLLPLATASAVVTVPLAAAVTRLGLLPAPELWPALRGRLVEPLVAAVPGALTPPTGLVWDPRTDVPGVARALAGAGRLGPFLHESGVVAVSARAVPTAPPTGLADLVTRVATCYPGAGVAPGTVRVEGVTGADGLRAWVVEIPGTQEWSALPGGNPADLTADVSAMAGAQTAAAATVARALELAGVRAGEPVLLAGHSLGGILAAALASDGSFTRRFRVTHVLAAGSPLGRVPVPGGVAVLALEHDDDAVPALDGAPDPDRPDWVTVSRAPVRARAPGAAHDALAYAATAALVEDSGDPSLRAWYAGLAPFLARPGATATALEVTGRRVHR